MLNAAAAYGCALTIAAASDGTPVQQTTAERVAGARWWPTRPMPATAYVGVRVCAECHQTKVESQSRSAMARTATRAADSAVLRPGRVLTFTSSPYLHEIATEGGTSVYSLSDGKQRVSAALHWAFGAEKVGQTFIFERNGAMYESRASYFGTLDRLDFTPGRTPGAPVDLEAGLGRRLSDAETRRCFGCHTSSLTVRDGVVTDAVPGVTCEGCHGPGRAHADAMRAHRDAEGLQAIVNPAPFTPVDSVDFCGACHGTYWDVTLANERGARALRSQPFRLQSSRCWDEGERRITCVACHDPHAPLDREPRAYDARCLACHQRIDGPAAPAPSATPAAAPAPHAAACKARRSEACSTCHMPKYRVDEMHFSFTDHLIRVVRKD